MYQTLAFHVIALVLVDVQSQFQIFMIWFLHFMQSSYWELNPTSLQSASREFYNHLGFDNCAYGSSVFIIWYS